MKILITGSRNATNYEQLKAAIDYAANYAALNLPEYVETLRPTLILHGGAAGGDQLAQRYADEHSLPTVVIKPDYEKHHYKAAPLLRNTVLVEKAELVIAYYAAGQTRKGGTWDTAQKATKAGKLLLELTEGEEWPAWTIPQRQLF